MKVAAIIVTRGDQELTPVLASLPEEWDVLVWNNGAGSLSRRVLAGGLLARVVTGEGELPDYAVYGRYAAIEYTDAELIYVQDDDCIVSDPAALVSSWMSMCYGWSGDPDDLSRCPHVVCNMPPEFRHDFYEEHALVGFGAAFHRDAPGAAFGRFFDGNPARDLLGFYRTCDIVFTALTPRVLVDVPHEDMPWAHHESRMWKQPGHLAERVAMLDLVRQLA